MKLFDARRQPFAPLGAGPLRLVSLVPSTTETLFALGRGDDLVGYTRFAVHPAEKLSRDRWIGGTKSPKIERILALRPDLVLANREENRAEDVAALEDAGIPVWVAEPRSVGEAVLDLRHTAMLVGRAEQGETWALRIERALDALRAVALAVPCPVVYLIWQEPWMAAGQQSFIASLLTEAGLRVTAEGRYPTLTPEEMRAAERVLLSSEPFPFDEAHRQALVEAGFAPEQVQLVDGERLSWHGVRLEKGLHYLRTLLDAWFPDAPRSRSIPDEFRCFVARANAGAYREALLALEAVWLGERSEFYAGLLQLMVALNQGQGGRTLRRARERLTPYAPRHAGVDVDALLAALETGDEGAPPGVCITLVG